MNNPVKPHMDFRRSFQLGSALRGMNMSTTQKPPRKAIAGKAEKSPQESRKGAPVKPRVEDFLIMGAKQLKKVDQMLDRIEQKGEELSTGAEKLLRRVS